MKIFTVPAKTADTFSLSGQVALDKWFKCGMWKT